MHLNASLAKWPAAMLRKHMGPWSDAQVQIPSLTFPPSLTLDKALSLHSLGVENGSKILPPKDSMRSSSSVPVSCMLNK